MGVIAIYCAAMMSCLCVSVSSESGCCGDFAKLFSPGGPVLDKKLDQTLDKVVETLKERGFDEDELLRVRKEVAEELSGKTFNDVVSETCGTGPLPRCPREDKPPPGHVCEDVEPIDPPGPFCNCAECQDTGDSKKKPRETPSYSESFDSFKSERTDEPLSFVYDGKWSSGIRTEQPRAPPPDNTNTQVVNKIKSSKSTKPVFSSTKVESVFKSQQMPISNDPEFQEEYKMLTEGDQTSAAIRKYHEKKIRDEAEL